MTALPPGKTGRIDVQLVSDEFLQSCWDDLPAPLRKQIAARRARQMLDESRGDDGAPDPVMYAVGAVDGRLGAVERALGGIGDEVRKALRECPRGAEIEERIKQHAQDIKKNRNLIARVVLYLALALGAKEFVLEFIERAFD